MPSRTVTAGRNPFSSSGHERQTVMTSSQPAMTNNQTVTRPAARTVSADDKVIIAIDAGHGGQDPGAIGPNGTKEKNVTIAIARKLRALLRSLSAAPFRTRSTQQGARAESRMAPEVLETLD